MHIHVILFIHVYMYIIDLHYCIHLLALSGQTVFNALHTASRPSLKINKIIIIIIFCSSVV